MDNKKKKVLIVHNYYQIPGGEDIVVANEKKMLEDHGHRVVLYSRSNSEIIEMGLSKKVFLPFSTLFNVKTYFEVRKIIRDEKIDIVHVHNTLNLISPSVYYVALSMRVPVVQTIHNFRLLCPGATLYRDGDICEECIRKGLRCAIKYSCYRNNFLQTLVCVLSTKLHRFTKVYKKVHYICLTNFNKEKLVLFKQIEEENVFVKPNFVCVQDFKGIVKARENCFIYAGRLDKIKGVDILFEAWSLIEKKMGSSAPELLVFGTGPLEDWCRSYVVNNELKKVFIKGFVHNTEVREYIAKSKALILPTRWYEGFPMTILEAYSVGTPVIVSDIGNVASVVVEGVTGEKMICGSVESLCSCVQNFDAKGIDNEEVYNHFKSLYSEEKNYSLLNDIYEKVGGKNGKNCFSD